MSQYSHIDPITEKLFESIIQKVDGQFDLIRKPSNIGGNLLIRFEEFKKYKDLYVHKVTELKGKNGSFIILLIEKHLTIVKPKRQGGSLAEEIEEMEPILIFSIPYNVGKAYIRRETLGDKVTDLILKQDLDFKEYLYFSKNYYFVAEYPQLIKEHLPKGLLEALELVEDLTVEINENWGMIRAEKNLTEDLLLHFIGIGQKIIK